MFVTEHYLKYQHFKTHVFLKMTPCLLVKMYGLFGGPCSFYLPAVMQKIVSSILKIQVRRRKTPCETSAAVYLTTLRYIPEDLNVYYPPCGISNIIKKYSIGRVIRRV